MPDNLSPVTRRFLPVLILLTGLLHGIMAISFDLSTDEAHYALYGFFPALSYFDHPPLVGWSQIPFITLFGGNPPDWALRLVPLLSHAATLWLLTVFAARHFGQHAARWTALIVAVAPLPHMLGAAQVPDTLLIFWAAALLVQTDRLMQTPQPSLRHWLLFGLTLGLAGLSKYTAAFFVPSLLACLLSAHGGRLLLSRGPWLAALCSALVISPVILWNAQHEWISFFYQCAHGTGNKAWQFSRAAQQLVLQLLVYGPLLTLLPLWLLRRAHRPLRHPVGLILLLAVPFILIMLFLAGRSNALPHWTAPAWLLLAPLAGWQAAQLKTRAVRIVAALQALLCLVLVGWMLSGGTPDPDGLNNPPADLYGWRAAGEKARALAQEQGIDHLAVQNWSIASRLAWYARPLPLHVLDSRFDQFDLWYGDLPTGADALVIDWSSLAYRDPVGEGQFQSCTPLAQQDVLRWGKTLDRFSFLLCRHWGGHAQPREQGDDSP